MIGKKIWYTKCEGGIKKIILHGSYARGDFNDSSDIDIMIFNKYMLVIKKHNTKIKQMVA